ncbi:MAG: NAD(P)-dependent oxidoreductase [Desulfuromonadaceae bacterium]
MKITVIGATRGIGLALVKMALERGHEVTALVRDPKKMPLEHPKLKICVGDILSKSSVETALAGQDAVCTTIGASPSLKPMDIFSEGSKNVLAAMKALPDIKLIAVTGIGAGDSRGHGGFLYGKIFQPLLLKTIYEDKDREEAVLKASSADWMILRPGMLTNGKFTGKYRVLTDMTGVTAGKISRVDVADFILRQFEQPTYFKQTPLLTY